MSSRTCTGPIARPATFIAFLARSLRNERVLLLLSYRSDELHRRHPLRPLLAELERLERTRRIELEPFDRAELAEALTDILGEPPDATLWSTGCYARSEGNPLYIEELLAAGLDGRGAAPQSLRDAFMLRIERLPRRRSAPRPGRSQSDARSMRRRSRACPGSSAADSHGALREARRRTGAGRR